MIDMDYDGRTVLGISSLSPEWQALRAQIWEAPGRVGSDARSRAGGNADRGLMLRVSGKEVGDIAARQSGGDVDALIKRFGSALESLDEVLGEEDGKAQQQQDEGSNVIRTQRPGSGVE